MEMWKNGSMLRRNEQRTETKREPRGKRVQQVIASLASPMVTLRLKESWNAGSVLR